MHCGSFSRNEICTPSQLQTLRCVLSPTSALRLRPCQAAISGPSSCSHGLMRGSHDISSTKLIGSLFVVLIRFANNLQLLNYADWQICPGFFFVTHAPLAAPALIKAGKGKAWKRHGWQRQVQHSSTPGLKVPLHCTNDTPHFCSDAAMAGYRESLIFWGKRVLSRISHF